MNFRSMRKTVEATMVLTASSPERDINIFLNHKHYRWRSSRVWSRLDGFGYKLLLFDLHHDVLYYLALI
ncbi:hypothetical protein CPB83DRAFT_862125 [Crepidotus variabilis]|uniref:Uncharacterized protein n=1 Tax=Crepidotus variabilis TaxID=179855 RepID=A0A9P6E7I3_9AGAR|nr:hypothetical protein CPB83DRAFT_862125 [Crepidotus variabilis]